MKVRLPKGESKNVSESGDIARIMQKVLLRQNKFHRNKEYFWTIGLNSANDIQYIELVSIGTKNRNILAPVDVYSLAVSKKCTRVIFCHNHPSEKLNPSAADLDFTKSMKQAGSILGIKLADHIIISETDFVSI
ncbi:MAG: JAB domain-containing protein [Bacteroidota bacterium]